MDPAPARRHRRHAAHRRRDSAGALRGCAGAAPAHLVRAEMIATACLGIGETHESSALGPAFSLVTGARGWAAAGLAIRGGPNPRRLRRGLCCAARAPSAAASPAWWRRAAAAAAAAAAFGFLPAVHLLVQMPARAGAPGTRRTRDGRWQSAKPGDATGRRRRDGVVSDALSSETRRAGTTSPSRARGGREEKRAVRDARARDRAMRQVSLRTPEPRGVLSRTSERTGRPRRGVREARCVGAETRDEMEHARTPTRRPELGRLERTCRPGVRSARRRWDGRGRTSCARLARAGAL